MAGAGFHFLYGRLQAKFSIGPHPKTEFFVRKCGLEEWQKFSRYHYLSNDIAPSNCYGLFTGNDDIIGFCAVRPFPHPLIKHMRKCHRIVILPEYQGIGLGTKFLATVAELYKNEGCDFRIRTTLKNFSRSLVKSGLFICLGANISKEDKTIMKYFKNRCRKVKAVSLKYIGEFNEKRKMEG